MDGLEFERIIREKQRAYHVSRKEILKKVKILSVSFPVIQDFGE